MKSLAVSAAALAMVLLMAMPVAVTQAADTRAPPKGAAARDFTGIWINANSLDEVLRQMGKRRADDESRKYMAQKTAELGDYPRDILTPEYVEVQKKQRAEEAKYAVGTAKCYWPGMPGIMTYPYPFEFLHTPGRINLLFEADSQIRRIWMDRKEHLPVEELDPTYNGDSIGRWEGDTLVVDTIGFNTNTRVRNLPHSDELRIVERIRYVAADILLSEMTFTDPKAYTRPFTVKVEFRKHPDWRIREYSCNENNRSEPDAEGKRSGAVVE